LELKVKGERGDGLLRWLDRWLGIPSLGFLSIFRRKRVKPLVFNSVGICAFAAIGDGLLASSLIADLRRSHPRLKIIIFATKANLPAFSLVSGFDELVLVPITSPMAALREMRAHPVDVLIDTSQWSRIGAILTLLSGAGFTIGFKTSGQYRHFSYDFSVKHSSNIHELQNFWALLGPLGISAGSLPSVNLSAISSNDCLNIKQPYLVFHPWASGSHYELREWPFSSWVKLTQRAMRSGYGVVISGGPSDIVRAGALVEGIEAAGSRPLVNLAGKSDLRTTAAYLRGAAGVVSVNTGIMHLAALLDMPLVALHGPTNPSRWGPIYPGGVNEQNTVVLGPGLKEGGSYLNLGFEHPANPTYLMDRITVDVVVVALRKLSINIA
jgi:ADP-heptose:LPS heptosyltransferase